MSTPSSRKRERHRSVPLMPEVRHFKARGLEVREQADTDEIIITGQPIVYNAPYSVTDAFGTFRETMMPGVARDALSRGADVRFLVNHEGLALARSTSGTMTFRDTSGGLDFEARLDARQQMANDLAIAVARGDCSAMSCAFSVARDEWDDAMENRTVRSFAEFIDVSAVTYPCSPTTSLQVAQRMALEQPIESRARLRRLYVEMRAGRALTARDQQLVKGLLGQFEPGEAVRSSGRVRTGNDLRRELAQVERTPRSARATKAADLRRTLAELDRKRREAA
jgi:HK97 family phage prohead protease